MQYLHFTCREVKLIFPIFPFFTCPLQEAIFRKFLPVFFLLQLRFLRDISNLHLFLPRLGGISSKTFLYYFIRSSNRSSLSFPFLSESSPSVLSSFTPSFLNLIASIFDFSSFLHYLQNSQPNVVFALSSISSYFMLVSTLSQNKTKLTSTNELNDALYFATNFKTNKITV